MRIFSLMLLFYVPHLLFAAKSLKIMLITGGHAYDTLQFMQIFDEMESVGYEHFSQPDANAAIMGGKAKNFDVLVFYDMWKEISGDGKKAYQDLGKSGKPLLFLHHSIVSYQEWEEFEGITGGRYLEKKRDSSGPHSTYKHDIWMKVRVAAPVHPAVKGLNDFMIYDEAYGNLRISDQVKPLLSTDHPESSSLIAWEHSYEKSKIVYISLGHNRLAYENVNFRKLIFQSIRYLAGK